MRRDARAVLLLLVGGAFLKAGLTGTYLNYVHRAFLPLVLLSGVALVVLAAVTLWQSVRGAGRRPEDAAATSAAGGLRVGWSLLLPALTLLLIAPPALGSFQASRVGAAPVERVGRAKLGALAEEGPVRVSLRDYASFALHDQGQTLAGRRLVLSGFVTAGPEGQPYLTRFAVSCCAADARPAKVGLAGDIPTTLRPGEWVEVEGIYTERVDRDPVNGAAIPYLLVTGVRSIPAPSWPYES